MDLQCAEWMADAEIVETVHHDLFLLFYFLPVTFEQGHNQ
jgi:hypothetical protein